MKLKHFNAMKVQATVTCWWLAINKRYDVYVDHLKIELFKYQEGWEL